MSGTFSRIQWVAIFSTKCVCYCQRSAEQLIFKDLYLVFIGPMLSVGFIIVHISILALLYTKPYSLLHADTLKRLGSLKMRLNKICS